jgi:hypothetical protein
MKNNSKGWLLAAALWTLAISTAAAAPDCGGFGEGERLVYEIRWMLIPAGEAVLEVAPMDAIDGHPARHFLMTVRTNAFVDTFYTVRDRIEAWTDVEMTHSLHYRKLQREGSHRMRDVRVNFDWKKRLAVYTNHGKEQAPITLVPGTFDPLAALYFTRLADLALDTIVERPVTDGKINVPGRARVVGRESIQVPAGTFDTVVIEPDLSEVRGVFEKSPGGRIRIWLSDDGRRIPVRVQSKVAVGHFVGELTSAEGPSADGRGSFNGAP